MTRDELSRPAAVVILPETRTASAATVSQSVGLTWQSEPEALAVLHLVMGKRFFDFEIFRPIITLDAVRMVDLLTLTKGAPDFLFGNEAMLVDVPSNIGKMVSRHSQEDVPVRGNDATAFPIVVFLSAPRHAGSIARRQPARMLLYFPIGG